MDFNDSPEEAAFRRKARNWLDENAPSPEERQQMAYGAGDEEQGVALARAWQARKADAGWACIHWPEEYGGRGASAMERIIFEQEEEDLGVPNAYLAIGLGMCAPTLMTYADPEQKARHVPRLLRGDEIWCQLFSEPAAGSDLAGVRMTARRDGDHWILDGQKTWTSGAHHSEFGLLVARSDPQAPKHAGLTAFFLDMASPGISIRPIRQITGPSGFNEVFFDGVRVPDAQRLGAPGAGWRVCLTTLMNERLSLGDVARPDFDDLLAFCRTTVIDGNPAASLPDVRQKLADWYVQSRGLRYTRFRTLSALSRGEEPGPESSIMKLVSTAAYQQMAGFACELEDMGGVLASGDPGEFQYAYLFAPSFRIAGGTDEILRTIIADRVLRLPPEPRTDRDLPFNAAPASAPPRAQ